MNPVRQILVDLDGTLLGNRALPLGFDFVFRAIRTLSPLGGVRRALRGLRAVQRELSESARPHSSEPREQNDIRVVRKFGEAMGLSPEESRKQLRTGLLEIFPSLRRHFYPMPGAKEFLDWANTRYPLVLATNPVWPPEIIEMRIRWAGIDPACFRSITHVRLMSAAKPSREYYQQILAMEGFDARRTLLIGNDEKMDLPATQLGISVYLIDSKSRSSPEQIPGTKGLGFRGSFGQLRALLEQTPLD